MTAAQAPIHCPKRYKRADDRWASLSARIREYSPLLVNQGDLVLKQIGARRYWYLRFLLPADERGHRRHKCLYVGREGDLELVGRVQSALDECRTSRHHIEEIAGYGRIMRSMNRALRAAGRRHGKGLAS